MKLNDKVTMCDGKIGVIVEILSRYVMIDIGDLRPRVYIKRDIKENKIKERRKQNA